MVTYRFIHGGRSDHSGSYPILYQIPFFKKKKKPTPPYLNKIHIIHQGSLIYSIFFYNPPTQWSSKPACGKFVKIRHADKKSKWIVVRILDSCAGCATGSAHIDLTTGAFKKLYDLDVGSVSGLQAQMVSPPLGHKWTKADVRFFFSFLLPLYPLSNHDPDLLFSSLSSSQIKKFGPQYI